MGLQPDQGRRRRRIQAGAARRSVNAVPAQVLYKQETIEVLLSVIETNAMPVAVVLRVMDSDAVG